MRNETPVKLGLTDRQPLAVKKRKAIAEGGTVEALGKEIFTFNKWEYDIDGLKRLIAADPYPHGPHECEITDKFLHHISGYKEISEERIATISKERLQEPPISVRLKNGETRVVDGHHRIRRLHKDGATSFLMFLVEYEDSLPYVTNKRKFRASKKVRLR